MYKLNKVIRRQGRATVFLFLAAAVMLIMTADLIDLKLLDDRKVLMLVGAAMALAWFIAAGYMAIVYLDLREARSQLRGEIRKSD